MNTPRILHVQWHKPEHAAAAIALLDEYARSPEGGGQALSAHVREQLPRTLAARAGTHSLLAFAHDAQGREQPAGFANAFEGFSTFACQPLLNIHDLAVSSAFRGQGIARALLAELQRIAQAIGACKLTLEVLSGNVAAQRLYRSAGFAPYVLDENMGVGEYWQKYLPE